MTAVPSMDGQIISDHVWIHKHWSVCFEQIDPLAVCLDASGVLIPVMDPSINEKPPTLTDVKEAICKLKVRNLHADEVYHSITLLSIPRQGFCLHSPKQIHDHLQRH